MALPEYNSQLSKDTGIIIGKLIKVCFVHVEWPLMMYSFIYLQALTTFLNDVGDSD